jgi:hypothetical protein
MTLKTWKQVSWLPALALGAGLGLSSPAEACSAPVCEPDVKMPGPPRGGGIPANVPALVLFTDDAIVTSGDGAPRLLRANGDVVASSTVASSDDYHVWFVVPESPLVPGESYQLQARGECTTQSNSSKSAQFTFTAAAARPLPSATGTLTVGETGRGSVQVAHPAQCSSAIDAGYVRFHFTPAPELVPFLPWVRWTLDVDGTRWASTKYGTVLPDGTLAAPLPRETYFGERRLFQVHAACGTTETYLDRGRTPGRHHATLRAVLANAPSALPPVELDFELTCPGPGEPPPPTPQQPEPVTSPDEKNPNGFGCSQATGPGMGALVGLLALGFLVRRGTRRVPSPSGS